MNKVYDRLDTLCASCNNSTILKLEGRGSGHVVRCHQLGTYIKARVSECNAFAMRNAPDEWRMREIAWILRTDPMRKKVGFISPDDPEHEKLKRRTHFPGED